MVSGQTVTGKYERKIQYLDYMENGIRTKGAGFVRLERWDGFCSISMQISGLYRRDHFTRPLLMLWQGQERELCRLEFAEGGAKFSMDRMDIHNMDGQGLVYEELVGIRIPVSEGKEIRCVWGEFLSEREDREQPEAAESQTVTEPQVQEEMQPEAEPSMQEDNLAERYSAADRNSGEVQEPWREEEIPREIQQDEKKEWEKKTEEWKEKTAEEWEKGEAGDWEEKTAEDRMEETPASEPDRMGEPLNDGGQRTQATLMHEEKWEQLQAIYPHIFPFQDEREYLSMGPADFVILPRRYYKLVSNSFLLHGFYNYDHLILARMEQRGAVKYYIGVPGNYYEREKKVAVLFGFQSFECEREPAREGDFGYYMIPVEL